jgi:DEAD/DEAH box helicase
MLPSLLAHDIQQGIKQFLITGFAPADGSFHAVMRRFVDHEAAWMNGPYLQISLSCRHDRIGRNFFKSFQTADPAYTHQRQAWQRLTSDRLAAPTLVATGTGSGKTEYFVYPALDHCARARQAGEAGSKVLVIYPMNALAMDQARRLAQLIARTPAFHGLRVGLFVGGSVGPLGSGMLMNPDSVITDRDTMRRHPPDILLTHDTMLDDLLIRPRDRQLWEGTARPPCASPEAALAAWVPVFFPEVPVPADVSNQAFRVTLGAWLKRHLLFANLIRLRKGRVISLPELYQQMQGPLPESARAHIRLVLDALLALVAWALAPDGRGPLVTLRLQVWMHELHRMVGKVTSKADYVELRADKDLKARPDGLYLPLIQCSECHTTGWLPCLPPASRKLSNRLDEIYNTWFSGRSEEVRLYAGAD